MYLGLPLVPFISTPLSFFIVNFNNRSLIIKIKQLTGTSLASLDQEMALKILLAPMHHPKYKGTEDKDNLLNDTKNALISNALLNYCNHESHFKIPNTITSVIKRQTAAYKGSIIYFPITGSC